MPKGVETEYAKQFRQLPEGAVKETYMDMNDVQISQLDENIRLHYTKNTKNNIFTLTLRYGVGTKKIPMLEYSVALMNSAGMMPDMDPQSFRRRLSELGGRIAYGVSESYLTVQILGEDEHMEEICKLVNMQILMPKLDKKQLDAFKGQELNSRFTLKKMHSVWADALREYVLYGKESRFLDVVPFMDIYDMNELRLSTDFQEATKYALDVHYCGTHCLCRTESNLPHRRRFATDRPTPSRRSSSCLTAKCSRPLSISISTASPTISRMMSCAKPSISISPVGSRAL